MAGPVRPRHGTGAAGDSAGPTQSGPQRDWATQLTGLVATGVAVVRDRSVRPAMIVAAAVMIGLTVLGTVIGMAVLGAVGLARLFNNLAVGHRMWATYCVAGGIFVLLGALVLSVGNRRASRATR